MTPEDVKRIEAIQETVNSPGWKHLLEDVDSKVTAIKEDFSNPSITVDLLRLGQGRLFVYKELQALPQIVDSILANNKLDEEEAALEQASSL